MAARSQSADYALSRFSALFDASSCSFWGASRAACRGILSHPLSELADASQCKQGQLPCRMRRMLHRPIDHLADPRYAEWQAGWGTLRPADGHQWLRHLRPSEPSRILRGAAGVGGDVRPVAGACAPMAGRPRAGNNPRDVLVGSVRASPAQASSVLSGTNPVRRLRFFFLTTSVCS